jgi:hypothetical protein
MVIVRVWENCAGAPDYFSHTSRALQGRLQKAAISACNRPLHLSLPEGRLASLRRPQPAPRAAARERPHDCRMRVATPREASSFPTETPHAAPDFERAAFWKFRTLKNSSASQIYPACAGETDDDGERLIRRSFDFLLSVPVPDLLRLYILCHLVLCPGNILTNFIVPSA